MSEASPVGSAAHAPLALEAVPVFDGADVLRSRASALCAAVRTAPSTFSTPGGSELRRST